MSDSHGHGVIENKSGSLTLATKTYQDIKSDWSKSRTTEKCIEEKSRQK